MQNRTPRPPKSLPRREAPPRRPGMTLVELLVVISIIILLVTMLLPSFTRVKQAVYRSRSQARLNELAAGAVQYANANKGLYPGQMYPGMLTNSGGSYTGGQVLAVSLFNLRYQDVNPGAPDPNASSLYAPFAKGDLFQIPANNGSWHIWDRYSSSPPIRAVCYYPSRLGVSSDVRQGHQYVEGDNAAYTSGMGWLGGSFDNPGGFITARNLDINFVCNPGTFLLIGAATDANYGTTDDVKNFAN
jgi:type II secretory pathway pseudopilin PulG